MPRPKHIPHHLPHGMGRTKETWPPIPDVPFYKVFAVEQWLKEHRGSMRPLTCAAPLLAIVCALAEKEHPWPARRRLAERMYGADPEVEAGRKPGNRTRGTDSIDSALNTALAEGEIHEEWRVEQGDVNNRSSIRRVRYLLPSDDLNEIYKEATRGNPGGRSRAQPLRNVG